MQGTAVKQLMENAKSLFADLTAFLDGVAEDHGVNDFFREQIATRLEIYANCLHQFDSYFSKLRATEKDSEFQIEEIIQKTHMFRDAALKLWRQLGLSVTPKLHMLEDHCIDYMETYGFLGEFDEEFVECAHQTGVKNNMRTKGSARNIKKKYADISHHEHSAMHPVIARIKEEVHEGRKRNFKQPRDANNLQSRKRKKAREENREQSLADASLYDETELKSAAEINMLNIQDDNNN